MSIYIANKNALQVNSVHVFNYNVYIATYIEEYIFKVITM